MPYFPSTLPHNTAYQTTLLAGEVVSFMSVVVMDVRSGVRATLLALTVLWVGASLPHMYSTARAFFLESLPALVSAAMAPRCLFVFSNIIVAFLVGESKLSRRREKAEPCSSTGNVAAAATSNGVLVPERKEEEEEVMAVVTDALLPPPASFSGASTQEQENNMLMDTHEDRGSSVLNQGLMRMDQCEHEVDHLYDQHEVYDEAVQAEVEEEGGELDDELMLGEEHQDGIAMMQELQETDLPPADELNRRVEDFIARFNMERQLEAKMLVCCY